MKSIPQQVSKSVRERNPHLWPQIAHEISTATSPVYPEVANAIIPQNQPKPLLNATEERCCAILEGRGLGPIFKQAFTLRMDPPYKSYTPDLAFLMNGFLNFVEVKGLHRFREKGIAKAALAAKTYPLFRFWLHQWDGKVWKQSILSP